MFSTKEATLM